MKTLTLTRPAGTPWFAFLFPIALLIFSCSKGSAVRPSYSSNPDTATGQPGNTGNTSGGGSIPVGTDTLNTSIVPGAGPSAGITYTASPAITLSDVHDRVISGIATTSITLNNCYNITIKNCKIGPNSAIGIQTDQCKNVVVDSCYIYHVSTGIYALNSQAISVTNCQALNMQGPFPKGAFVQFDNVTGGGNRVSYNKFQNISGQSNPEDAISMYKSSGLDSDPIRIYGNWIRGGGLSLTGGGIMLGDKGGSNIIAEGNLLVDPGQYGMAVSGGTHMYVVNNSIYAKAQPFTNVGLYYWNQSGLPSSGITIGGNKVNFTSGRYGVNNIYLAPGEVIPSGWNTNILNANIDESLLPANLITQ
ncbi:MAG TPA: right-handed parallel beta-helix repeat-containing protein [Mucilaginibacter sp.]|nr:right-handed parallel beta-helix repeat-containing protein [Mucilaginibacter sp.]